MTGRRTSWVIGTALLLGATACGSTVPVAQQAGTSTSADGLSVTASQAPGAGTPTGEGTSSQGPQTSTDVPVTAGGTTGSAPTTNHPGDAVSGATSAPVETTPGAIPTKGPGWDAKNVYVGIITASDAAGALQALGVSLNPGDEIADAKAIVTDMNAKGGLFGRKVVLVVKDDASANVLANPSSAGQADCAYFAQDHPVISVVNTDASLDLDSFRTCFAKARIPLVTTTTSVFDDVAASSLKPFFYNALTVSWTRLIPILVTRLQAQSYFTGWNATTGAASKTSKVKVGVLYGTDGAGSRQGPALVKALKRAGYDTDSFQASGQGDGNAAVLKMAGDGVTHVIGLDTFQFFFMTSANSQHYRPRYGITTSNGPEALLASNGNHALLAGAVGVGWYPTLDVEDAQDPGPGPGTKGCLAALKAGGQTFSGKRFAAAVGFAICDGLQLGVRGAKAGGGLSPSVIRTGIVSLGSRFPTGGGFSSGLSATNYALPGAGRDLAWVTACDCFQYSGKTYPIS